MVVGSPVLPLGYSPIVIALVLAQELNGSCVSRSSFGPLNEVSAIAPLVGAVKCKARLLSGAVDDVGVPCQVCSLI